MRRRSTARNSALLLAFRSIAQIFQKEYLQLSCAERDKVVADCDHLLRLTLSPIFEVANCDHLQRLKFSPTMPFAFTEHGELMAAYLNARSKSDWNR